MMGELEDLFAVRWPNFRPWEVLSSDGLRAWDEKGAFVLNPDALTKLQRLRDVLGYPVYVNGYVGGKRGYRSPRENMMIDGSAEFSRHVFGDAFDVTVEELGAGELFDLAVELGWTGVKEYETWVHMDMRPVVIGEPYRERLL